MTRKTNMNLTGMDRAAMARKNGADCFFIIHFNAVDGHRARGTLEVRRTKNNVHPEQDTDLMNIIIPKMVDTFHSFGDAGSNHHNHFDLNAMNASDVYLGNELTYCPIRVGYCEVEFIDFGANTSQLEDDDVDILLNTGGEAAAVRLSIADSITEGIFQEINTHQPPN